jgi:hypothetical protein
MMVIGCPTAGSLSLRVPEFGWRASPPMARINGPMVAPSRTPGTVVLAMNFAPRGWTFHAWSRSKIIPRTFQNQSEAVPKRWDPKQRSRGVSAGHP